MAPRTKKTTTPRVTTGSAVVPPLTGFGITYAQGNQLIGNIGIGNGGIAGAYNPTGGSATPSPSPVSAPTYSGNLGKLEATPAPTYTALTGSMESAPPTGVGAGNGASLYGDMLTQGAFDSPTTGSTGGTSGSTGSSATGTGVLSYGEYYAQQEALLDEGKTEGERYYNNAYDTTMASLEEAKAKAIADAESARARGLVDAESVYGLQTGAYSRNAEALASRGLTNSGYSDFLAAQAASDRTAARMNANAQADSAISAAESDYASKALSAAQARDQGIYEVRSSYRAGLSALESEKKVDQANAADILAQFEAGNAPLEDVLNVFPQGTPEGDKAIADQVTAGVTAIKRASADNASVIYDGIEEMPDVAKEKVKATPAYSYLEFMTGKLDAKEFIDAMVTKGMPDVGKGKGYAIPQWTIKNFGRGNDKLDVYIGEGANEKSYAVRIADDRIDPDSADARALNAIAGADPAATTSKIGKTYDSSIFSESMVVHNGKLYIYYGHANGKDKNKGWYEVEPQKDQPNAVINLIAEFYKNAL